MTEPRYPWKHWAPPVHPPWPVSLPLSLRGDVEKWREGITRFYSHSITIVEPPKRAR